MKMFLRCGLAVLIFGTAPALASSIFDLSNNDGVDNLFSGGTDFFDIDGAGLNLTITGNLILGSSDLVYLPIPSALEILSGKRSATKVTYELSLVFSAPVPDFYLGTAFTSNREEIQLDLAPNGTETWDQNIVLAGDPWGSITGLGTPLVVGTGPNGGDPVATITVASGPVQSLLYTYNQQGSGDLYEAIFFGQYDPLGPTPLLPPIAVVPIPEPGTMLTVAIGLLLVGSIRFFRRGSGPPK